MVAAIASHIMLVFCQNSVGYFTAGITFTPIIVNSIYRSDAEAARAAVSAISVSFELSYSWIN